MFDYDREAHRDIAFVDIKSFYASVECVQRQLHPLTTSLCVMSRSDNSSGLILASSPTFKRVFGQNNVGRARDLPFDITTRRFDPLKAKRPYSRKEIREIEAWAQKTLIVPPRMALYIEENLKIQEIFRGYAPTQDICPYSIDEGFIDLTASLNYFYPDPSLSKKEKLDLISGQIQQAIQEKTGLFATVGMSNANPLLAKLALDIEAKHTPTMRANWSYPEVQTKLWPIQRLQDMWGIGPGLEKRLQALGIHSIYDLAHFNPDILEKKLGVIGVQLWFHAHGIDESKPSDGYQAKSQSIGNSQVLPYDYIDRKEVELVIREMAEQVAIRLRKNKLWARGLHLFVGYSLSDAAPALRKSTNLPACQSTKTLAQAACQLFRRYDSGHKVRQIGVTASQVTKDGFQPISLFDSLDQEDKENTLDKAMDDVRQKFGFTSIHRASALLKGSRSLIRSQLIGGHCGGLEGLNHD